VVRNPDGSLTGYFDYRPKDADEAITVARSTDGGKSWTSEGEALEQNHGYCPTADTNDDGQGRPYVAAIGGSTKLYTLNRPAGDYEGVGLLVHNVEPNAADPLAGLPSSESVGGDPNTYAEAEVEVPTSGGGSIPVSTLGGEGSPEHIVAGLYEDYNAASPSKSLITCTGTNPAPMELTGCTVAGAGALTVKAKDDIVQVIATVSTAATIPAGPNKTSGEGGLESLKFTSGNTIVSPLTTFMLNENAPNRLYINGDTVYCTQSNANPTTKVEDCTNTSGSPLPVSVGAAITSDPILPPDASVTTGLKAPDGILGTLPSYPGAPSGSTVVLYTQKVLAYFIVGTTDGSVSGSTYKTGTISLPATTITYTPSVHPSEPLPTGEPFKVYVGTETGKPIQEVTCTGFAPATQTGVPAGSYNLTGCGGGTGSVKEGNWIGGPHAAIAPIETLEKIGERKNTSKGPEKLFGNNEDLTVLRAAYTENGINFTDLGAISGSTSGTGNDSDSYNDVSNPDQQTSPSNTSPTDFASGESDTTELRFVGSRGTIVTNPNGSYGMFLSGAWATDGDSDAFNQIFYTSSTNGKEWSVPKVVVSTDYTFSAPAKQDEELSQGEHDPLGVSAYYSGRAYGPAVVQNANGSLTMVFSGYRLPKPIEKAGAVFGTNPSARYKIGEKDPALYRNILTVELNSATSPGVPTSTSVKSSDEPTGTVGESVTYTATVAPVPPGAGTPTGTVAFTDGYGPIEGCESRPLDQDSPNQATCTTALTHPGADEVTASYEGDANYAGSSGEVAQTAYESARFTSAESTTFEEGAEGGFTVTATGTPSPSISESGALPAGVKFENGVLSGTPTEEGSFPITLTASNGIGSEAVQEFTLTVDAAPTIISADTTTFTKGMEGSFMVTATGTPQPTISESGTLPTGVRFENGVLDGTPTEIGSFEVTLTARNGVGTEATQGFTMKVLGLHVTTTSVPPLTKGVGYSHQMQAAGGTLPYKWKLTAGSPPKGLKLSRTGLISGKVTTKTDPSDHPYTFTVTVTDHTKKARQTASAAFTLDVS
jgi:hypothetical protein